MDTFIVKAYAKINLGLDVLRRLENGYHEVKMVMQTVDIYDLLTFKLIEKGITVTTDSGELPTDDHNLVYKAAKLMMETFNITGGVSIHLQKNIPIAAGMAGGSSDAAATLRGLNQMFELGASNEELRKIAIKIGADVPYCIAGGTALSEGIGEILTTLKSTPACHVLVAKPSINVSTKFVYENLQVNDLPYHPDIDEMVKALEAGSLDGVIENMGNVLETVTIKEYPVIQEIKDFMNAHGASSALMSGSGPTVFGIFKERTTLEDAYRALTEADLAKQVFMTKLVNPAEKEE